MRGQAGRADLGQDQGAGAVNRPWQVALASGVVPTDEAVARGGLASRRPDLEGRTLQSKLRPLPVRWWSAQDLAIPSMPIRNPFADPNDRQAYGDAIQTKPARDAAA